MRLEGQVETLAAELKTMTSKENESIQKSEAGNASKDGVEQRFPFIFDPAPRGIDEANLAPPVSDQRGSEKNKY